MSIIEQKVAAAKEGSIDQAKSLIVIMNGTMAIGHRKFLEVANEDVKNSKWAKRIGQVVSEILPKLRKSSEQFND